MSTLDFAQSFRGKRVWLSGVTGFKGSWLAEWLLHLGAEVRGFSLPPPTKPSLFEQLNLASRIEWQENDIRDVEAVSESLCGFEPDFVFHLAAQPLVRLSYAEPVETWEINVLGTIQVLEALRKVKRSCSAVLITTDKVYENREWLYAYREEDALGGYDPYSSSKAGAEIAIASWRRSFFQKHPVRIGVARAGNVIGGGDWAQDRIVPDCIRALSEGRPVPVRNKFATRPWQHVLEPLSGYLTLACYLSQRPPQASSGAASEAAFNFGPSLESNQTVEKLVKEVLRHWPGTWEDRSDPHAPHEAGKLNLATDKAFQLLGWRPRWGFAKTIQKTVEWYRRVYEGSSPAALCHSQIEEYMLAEF
jgi:CDP-glucose 4,6-dehydratase